MDWMAVGSSCLVLSHALKNSENVMHNMSIFMHIVHKNCALHGDRAGQSIRRIPYSSRKLLTILARWGGALSSIRMKSLPTALA